MPLARPSTVPAGPIPDVLSGPGQPLAAPVKEEMEGRLGADFSDVRVHTDGAARASAAEVGARAYTSGSHVVIGEGGADKHTLAHELTHVIQQRQGPVAGTDHGNGLKVSDPSDVHEKIAEAHAARVMRAPLGHGRLQGTDRGGAAVDWTGALSPPGLVIQRAPTDEEKGYLRRSVGANYDNYRLETQNGIEYAMGLTDYYRLIRPANRRAYWLRYGLQRVGGRGFYGRLASNPQTMAQTGLTVAYFQAQEQAPAARFQTTHFVPAAPVGDRESNNRVMGQYFLGRGEMPASVYALRQHCEWLHMHGHGLGGAETPENLYAGSHAANSHMAAVEGAVQVMRGLYSNRITIDVTFSIDEDWHNDGVCDRIAAELGLDAATVRQAMQQRRSHMLEYVRYDVLVDNQRVWSERVDPFAEGAFDQGQFITLGKRVLAAIQKREKGIEFVQGGFLPGSGGGPSKDGGDGGSGSSSGMGVVRFSQQG